MEFPPTSLLVFRHKNGVVVHIFLYLIQQSVTSTKKKGVYQVQVLDSIYKENWNTSPYTVQVWPNFCGPVQTGTLIEKKKGYSLCLGGDQYSLGDISVYQTDAVYCNGVW